jgi:hypothetical protein
MLMTAAAVAMFGSAAYAAPLPFTASYEGDDAPESALSNPQWQKFFDGTGVAAGGYLTVTTAITGAGNDHYLEYRLPGGGAWNPTGAGSTFEVSFKTNLTNDSWTRAAELLRQDRKDSWLEIFAINLLGKSRRLELLEVIRERMNLYDDVQNEQIITAMVQLSDERVIEYLASLVLTENHDFTFSAFEVLARYPVASSQQVMLKAVPEPSDDVDPSTICSFLMRHIPTEPEVLSIVCKAALDPAQPFMPIDHLDELLLTQCKMTGIELPETDQLRQIGAERVHSRARSMVQSRAEWEDSYPDEFVMPVTGREKIGRNDPCPCGSGKKYKKCCLGKEPAK